MIQASNKLYCIYCCTIYRTATSGKLNPPTWQPRIAFRVIPPPRHAMRVIPSSRHRLYRDQTPGLALVVLQHVAANSTRVPHSLQTLYHQTDAYPRAIYLQSDTPMGSLLVEIKKRTEETRFLGSHFCFLRSSAGIDSVSMHEDFLSDIPINSDSDC